MVIMEFSEIGSVDLLDGLCSKDKSQNGDFLEIWPYSFDYSA
jgi:hypothetical protein